MKKKELFRFIVELIVVLSLVFITFNVFIKPIRVEGNSMYPTIQNGDLIITNTTNLNKKTIKRFDVIEIYSKKIQKSIIKRVIGLPGETIEYRNDRLYINGKYYKENFLDSKYIKEYKRNTASLFTNDFSFVNSGEGVFVMGDNRPNSLDSRVLGSIEYKDIFGKNGFLIFPFNRIKWVS